MSKLIQKYIIYSKNTVISLKELREKNPILYRLLSTHVEKQLWDCGYSVLNDEYTCFGHIMLQHSPYQIRAFVLYTYGLKINLTLLKRDRRKVYDMIRKFGLVYHVLKEWGLEPYYTRAERKKVKRGKRRKVKRKRKRVDKSLVL